MWHYPIPYDVIVVGGGHAGCEAALAAARRGASTLLLTMNLDTIAKMSCNPAVGGIGKGHMVREIDALGGEMGKVTDRAAIQCRMLNRSRGAAVWAPRAQTDKQAYSIEMKRRLEATSSLELKQATVDGIEVKGDRIVGVTTREGIFYPAKVVILSSGTFLRGLLHIGNESFSGGRAGDSAALNLSGSLESFGITLKRLKTGTPPRIHSRSIDFSVMDKQDGEEGLFFSFDNDSEKVERLPQIPCWITYSTEKTKEVIQKNIHRSPLYSGKIKGVGPRYCPSIEDKIVRFADKERHQLFLEPEGVNTCEYYINGLSTSLPYDVQIEIVHSVRGLENAEIMRPAYAIEYDYVASGQISSTLESKKIKGLFFTGQLNGTTGYEEAAAQGLIAGINGASRALGLSPFTLKRSEAYIGVMIDDLITKNIEEPYRMFTSRAEHRLLLRQDNADLRLRPYGYELGLIDEVRYQKLLRKKEALEESVKRFSTLFKQQNGRGVSLAQLLCRPEISYAALLQDYPEQVEDFGADINLQIELEHKYAGYMERERREVQRFEEVERILIPTAFDYSEISGLKKEASEKLSRLRPDNLGQASRINGVTAADIQILMIYIKRRR